MYYNGFLKVTAATPKIIAGDINNNKTEILKTLNESKSSVIVFPELAITGYTISDLFYQQRTLEETLDALKYILDNNKHEGIAAIGMPLDIKGGLFNVAVVIQKNKMLGVVPKYNLPNNGEFSEKRWFISGAQANFNSVKLFEQVVPFGNILFKEKKQELIIGVEICQDLWTIKTPSDDLSLAGANVILNLSASSQLSGKDKIRRNVVLDHSRKQMGAYIYTTTGIYESSAEALFSSHKIISSMGELIAESSSIEFESTNLEADLNLTAINYKRRQDTNFRDSIFNNKRVYQTVDFEIKENPKYEFTVIQNKMPFVPKEKEELEHIYMILVASLVKKLTSLPLNNRKIVVGISGGLDSTHALIIAYKAFKILNLPLEHIYPIIMPAKVSKSKNMDDAVELIEGLGLTKQIININESVEQHLKDLNHDLLDVTYENAQARIRTLVLMNLANKHSGFVLGTGDLSEIALGFMTYNGDQMSMYAINSGVPKTLMQELVLYYANNEYNNIKDCLIRIVDKKISPELLEDQNTEDIIGTYLVNDFILYNHLENGLEDNKLIWLIERTFNLSNKEATIYVNRFISRFYSQQFKRSTMPEGPKVFNISLSPRASYKLPSDIKRQ